MDERAIWYHPRNLWMIGPIENIGNKRGYFYTLDDFGGLCDYKNEWKFSNPTKGNDWEIVAQYEIVVRPSK